MNAQSAAAAKPAAPSTMSQLTEVMTRTLPQGGIDRMTDERIEEILAVPALTAHL
ncbi:hypothetical protein [Streptomonospora wellingtoniae]|uniref:Uncharacterized protein n=1 Tax=Streptomonospora wellingtoniae TaxID=3075544 RepID=A0ABU2KYV3_9ACTN|nr:hypothetical protein [Streptomonospora sp. DSM 45055]MDT0304327.1 hypothetical protein [Streptomonospora sp. DSM 45055]